MRTRTALLAVALAAGGAAVGCGGAATGGPGARGGPGAAEGVGADAGAYRRQVAPFPVRDSAGRPYDHPFLGGLDIPRPQLVDIDGDGDPDLFLQEASGRITFFERVGPAEGAAPTDRAGGGGPGTAAADSAGYVWRTDRFAGLEVGEWYRFADVDGDGDPDLLAEQPFSYIRYYRNEGPPSDPRFVLAADTLRLVDGTPIFSDRQNIPNVADIDCDGRLDLLVGRLTGTVSHFEEAERDAAGVPRFRLVTDRFEDIEIVRQFASRHGANTMALADVDADGDVDLFWGDFFEPGLLFIENTGTCPNPFLRGEPRPFPPGDPVTTSGYNAPTFGDLDGDGDPDLLMGVIGGAYDPSTTTVENLYHLENVGRQDGAGRWFVLRTRRFLRAVDVGSESIPAIGDVDGDGDPDLLLANRDDPDDPRTSRIHLFRNEGTASRPAFRHAGTLPMRGSYHYAPTLGDLDGDGAPDLVLGTWRDELLLYRNAGPGGAADADGGGERDDGTAQEGTPRFVLVDSALVTLTRGSHATPALGDVDGDGDLDLFVGESSGAVNFYRNVGTPSEPRFELVSDEFAGVDVERRSHPALADLDGDGDPDLVVGSESGELAHLRNEGGPDGPRFVPAELPAPEAPPLASPLFADLDGDGDLDFVSGGAGGGLIYLENRGSGG